MLGEGTVTVTKGLVERTLQRGRFMRDVTGKVLTVTEGNVADGAL